MFILLFALVFTLGPICIIGMFACAIPSKNQAVTVSSTPTHIPTRSISRRAKAIERDELFEQDLGAEGPNGRDIMFLEAPPELM